MLDTLQPIWHTQPETARRLRQRIRAVLEWAIVMQYRADNPCDRLGPALGRQRARVQHMRALPHAQVAAAIATARRSSAARAVKLAFEFLVLTAARSCEVRLATWDEIDWDGLVWTIPAMRMKAGREHRVPLSQRATEILDAARMLDGQACVFPGVRGKWLTEVSFAKLLRKLQVGAVPHGFRSSFRDWAAERTNHPREVIEAAAWA